MLIVIKEEYKKALNKKINIRIGNDDPTITYQEFFLYWVLYSEFSGNNQFLESTELYNHYKNSWIDEQWLKTKASKYNKIDISLEWNKVF